ncbi:uncharacterized protein LOC131881023 [Tigriopus californicus]|uniref:uncharacterized protein LOC131881023 n=1 Tax=Tigriopus californicus TaxID=6832 RepID=UPI0027D9F9F7|nr:uncharacterized protein LOC131881023 [Tigriopus californicus]
MASRGGPRAAGTDGNDYSHREIIKEQYYVSDRGMAHGRDNFQSRQPSERMAQPMAQPHLRRKMGHIRNDDPGVNESDEEDPLNPGWTNYEDRDEFFNELKDIAEQVDHGPHRAQDIQDLPLVGDYHGLGGPHSIPLASEGAFEPPLTQPHKNCLLDELFLAPSPEQLKAFQRIESKKEIAKNKNRFKWSVYCHMILWTFMAVKLCPAILDYLDVFVLELEELFIPKPVLWEWFWFAGIVSTFFGLSALKKSLYKSMTKSFYGLLLLNLVPVLFALVFYASDFFAFVKTKSTRGQDTWRGIPVAILWYAFLFLSLQVHLLELYFARVLIQAWQPKRKSN